MKNFKSNEFTTLIFITLGMWKWKCGIFNLPDDYKIAGWKQRLIVVSIVEEEILRY